MAGPIANQWTGNALADGIAIVAGTSGTNGVAAPGNFIGTGVTWGRAGTGTLVTGGNGIDVLGTTADAARIDGTITTPQIGVIFQKRMTVQDHQTAPGTHIEVRSSTAQQVNFALLHTDQSGVMQVPTSNYLAAGANHPALAVGDVIIIDGVFTQHSSPTGSNARFFYRIKNKTNASWATAGEFFYDSGYTLPVPAGNPSIVRFGKVSGSLLSGTPERHEFLGIAPVTVAVTDTSVAQAKAYFADEPVISAPLATPVVTLVSVSHPTTTGGTDGTATVSWPAVANADHYEAGIATGDVSAPTSTVSTSATSPFTFTGLGAGVKSLFIKAKAV